MDPGSGTGLRSTIRGEVAPQTFPAMQMGVDAAGQGAMQAGAQHRPRTTGAESGAVVSEEVKGRLAISVYALLGPSRV